MKKTTDSLKNLFYIAFAIFPLSMAVYFATDLFIDSAMSIHKGTEFGYNGFFWALPCTLTVVAFVFVIALLYVTGLNKKIFTDKNKFKTTLAVLIVALAVRLVLYFIFKSVLIPFSDGSHAWNAASGLSEDHLFFKSIQNGWNNFMGFLTFAINTFDLQYQTAILVQFVMDGLIAVVVYKLAMEIFGVHDIAFFSGLFYAVNPSVLMRMFYFSPDIFAQLCLTVATYLFVKMLKAKNIRYTMLYAVAAGIVIGLGNSFKSIALIFIVAMVITVAFKIVREKCSGKKMAVLALAAVVIVVPALGINKGVLAFSSAQTGVECRDLNTWHFINVGLNPYGEGQVGTPEAHYYEHLIIYGGEDPEVAKQKTIEFLKTGWEKTDREVLPWLVEKFKRTWKDDTQAFQKLMLNSISKEHNTIQHYAYMVLWNIASSGCQAFYIVSFIFAIAGVIVTIAKYRDNDGIFFASLYVFGFALLLLIIECQSRYKLNVVHYVGILAAVGMCEILKAVCNRLKVKDKVAENAETT